MHVFVLGRLTIVMHAEKIAKSLAHNKQSMSVVGVMMMI